MVGLQPYSIQGLACGQYNTAVLATKKKQPALLTWGPNFNGQLGYHFNELGPVVAPGTVDSLKGAAVVEVSMGYSHVLALAADGTVYV